MSTGFPVGKLLCVGVRGARPGDALLERDLDACAEAGVGAILLFDVDVPTLQGLQEEGVPREEALLRAERNILDEKQLKELIRYLRERLGEKVLIAIDQEGGQVARLSALRGFAPDPSAWEFAGLDASERRVAAIAQAQRLRDLGFDLNLAPCVDLALETKSEIIAGKGRSFGSDPQRVIDAASVVVEAHGEAELTCCLKHFPGHGSSAGDSHLGLVDITTSWRREEELQPYRALLRRKGVAVMVGHLLHRDLDAEHPASLSRSIIEGLLREELEFDGVVATDSIDMRALTDRYAVEDAAIMAIEAGADLVVDAFNLEERSAHPAPRLARALQRALNDGRIRGGEARILKSLDRLDRLQDAKRGGD